MSDIRVAQDPDRLPWLTDERKPRRASDRAVLLVWALLAALLVGGVAYWVGMQSATEADEPVATAPAPAPALNVAPPAAIVQPPAEDVQPAPAPEVQPVPEPVVRIPAPEPAHAAKPHASQVAAAKSETPPVVEKTPAPAPVVKPAPRPVARPAPLTFWPASVSEGASGRVVRIGAYGSRFNAKKGWWQIIQRYPGMRRLRAVVAPVPAPRTGRTYYRLQFGTTSQAHSEVLCQRMRAIRKTCAVVGLPERA